jgi:hypothetical protein
MVVSEVPTWLKIAQMDQAVPAGESKPTASQLLVDSDGNPTSYQELLTRFGDVYAEQCSEEHLRSQSAQIKQALARLKSDVADADIDLFLVVGDDQHEMFDDEHFMPALAVYYGDDLVSTPTGTRGRYGGGIGGLEDVHRGYALEGTEDNPRIWTGHGPFARHLIEALLERHFDVTAVKDPVAPAGLGHSYGVVEAQLMETPGAIPLVPILSNTYWPPSQLPAQRAWDLGLALREVIESYPEDLRVAMVASGGLSHFLVDESLDMSVLGPLREGRPEGLLDIPARLLNSGNSEIRNWMTVAACCQDLPFVWDEYIPVRRTPVGTGCGTAFARWGEIQR